MGSVAERHVRKLWIAVGLGTITTLVVGSASALAATDAPALGPAPTTTTLVSSVNPSVVGQAVTFTATVTKAVGTPVGTVQILELGSPLSTLPLVGGVATLATSTLTAGTHDLTAVFAPDPSDLLNSAPSVSAVLAQVVNTVGGGGGGGGGTCLPGQTTPTPTIVAPPGATGRHAITVHGIAAAKDPVDLLQRTAGQQVFTKVATTTAGSAGAYAFSRTVTKRTTFVARDQGACGPADSSRATTTVTIAPRLKLSSPHRGRLRMRVATSPVVVNQLARFYRVRKVGAPVLLAKVRTAANGVAHTVVKAHHGKLYRVMVTVSAPAGLRPGQSKPVSIRIS